MAIFPNIFVYNIALNLSPGSRRRSDDPETGANVLLLNQAPPLGHQQSTALPQNMPLTRLAPPSDVDIDSSQSCSSCDVSTDVDGAVGQGGAAASPMRSNALLTVTAPHCNHRSDNASPAPKKLKTLSDTRV